MNTSEKRRVLALPDAPAAGNPGDSAKEPRAAEATQETEIRRPQPEPGDVESVLLEALKGATAAGRWDVVAQLAEELRARRLASAGNVVPLPGVRHSH